MAYRWNFKNNAGYSKFDKGALAPLPSTISQFMDLTSRPRLHLLRNKVIDNKTYSTGEKAVSTKDFLAANLERKARVCTSTADLEQARTENDS